MKKTPVRELIHLTEQQVWSIGPKQKFLVVFDDGEMEMEGRFIHYNWNYWRLYREFTDRSVLMRHTFNGLYTADVHGDHGQELIWFIYDQLPPTPNIQWEISRVFYEITNQLDNDSMTKLAGYRTSGCLHDLIEVLEQEDISKAKGEYWQAVKNADWSSEVVKDAIEKAHKTVETVLYKDRQALSTNAIKKLAQSKNVSKGQLLQLIGPRGYVQDIDGTVFPYPIDVGYAEGMSSLYDVAIESRSAARALLMNTKPLQDSEYNNRTMQLHCSVTRSVHGKSCDHWETVRWTVEEGDELLLRGMNYMDNGKPVMIWKSIDHLIGKTIELRTPTGCGNQDTQTLCETCLGWLSRILPEGTNVGYTLSSALWAIITQLMLSTKHFEGSTVSLYLQLDKVSRNYIKLLSKDPSRVLLQKPQKKGLHYAMRIPQEFVRHINDVMVTEVDEVSPSRVSRCKHVHIAKMKGDDFVEPFEDINLTVAGSGASLTPDALAFLKEKGWTVGGGYIEFSLEGWSYDQPIFMTPRRGDNIYLYLGEVQSFLVPQGAATTDGKANNVTNYRTRTAALTEFIMLLRTRLDVNMAIAAIVIRACMTRNAEEGDYTLPRAGEPFGFTNTKRCLFKRSLTGAFAFEEQDNILLDGEFFEKKPRMTHLLDDIFTSPDMRIG